MSETDRPIRLIVGSPRASGFPGCEVVRQVAFGTNGIAEKWDNMTRIKAWKDDDGYALEFDDSRIELSLDGLSDFIEELRTIEATDVDSGETLATEFCIDLEDAD